MMTAARAKQSLIPLQVVTAAVLAAEEVVEAVTTKLQPGICRKSSCTRLPIQLRRTLRSRPRFRHT